MPVDKKKHTTASKSEAAPSTIPEAELLRPESFHQYLRAEIRQATRAVMEEIMREELSQFLGAEGGKVRRNAEAIAMASTRVTSRQARVRSKTSKSPETAPERSTRKPLSNTVVMSHRLPKA